MNKPLTYYYLLATPPEIKINVDDVHTILKAVKAASHVMLLKMHNDAVWPHEYTRLAFCTSSNGYGINFDAHYASIMDIEVLATIEAKLQLSIQVDDMEEYENAIKIWHRLSITCGSTMMSYFSFMHSMFVYR